MIGRANLAGIAAGAMRESGRLHHEMNRGNNRHGIQLSETHLLENQALRQKWQYSQSDPPKFLPLVKNTAVFD
jgi:hypothetical protein